MSEDQQDSGNVEQELVPASEASIEDLDAYLESAVAEEAAQEKTVAEEPSSPQTPQADGQTSSPEKPEDTAKPQERQLSPEEIAALQAENKSLKSSNEQKERFIQRRNTELGEFRKRYDEQRNLLLAKRKQLQEGLQAKYDLDPQAALDDRDAIKGLDEDIASIESTTKRAERLVESERTYLQHVDTEKVSFDDIAEVLKADGIPEDYIAEMKRSPFDFASADTLVQMAKRAEDRKASVKMRSDLGVLAKHIIKLNGEIATLKGKPKQLLNNVQRNLNQSPPITSGNGASAEDARPMVDPTRMTNEELNDYLKNAH